MAKEIKGTTKNGFEFCVNPNALDDFELIDMIGQLDEGKIQNLPKIYEKMLGLEQKNALCNHLRTEDGRVPVVDMKDALIDIINALKGKKS